MRWKPEDAGVPMAIRDAIDVYSAPTSAFKQLDMAVRVPFASPCD